MFNLTCRAKHLLLFVFLSNPFAFLFFIIFLVFSCSSEKNRGPSTDTIAKSIFKKNEVTVAIAEIYQGAFPLEVLSNGKANALNSSEIRFPMNEQILSIFVQNGDWVKKGQILAKLDNSDLKNKLSRSREAVVKARVELDDRLIDYGYRLDDSARVPAEIMRMAKVKSGYNTALYDYNDARTALNKSHIVAPFSGKIANLDARVFNASGDFKRLCSLIDDSRMIVEFNVLETEFHFLSKGSFIEISPFGGGSRVKGTVTQVNPLIDNNGMIKISALVGNSKGYLLDGMSVKVTVKKSVPNKMYVPKEAVLQRDNRQVVFTYEDGYAKWNYVETDLQNSRFICISSGLKPDQKVIISNNINLAHDSKVSLAKTGSGID